MTGFVFLVILYDQTEIFSSCILVFYLLYSFRLGSAYQGISGTGIDILISEKTVFLMLILSCDKPISIFLPPDN